MVRIGITGHSNLTADAAELVAGELRELLEEQRDDLVGVTCLARGADQVFVRVVLELGGRLEVVLPVADYRDRKVKPGNAAEFDSLIANASVYTMPFIKVQLRCLNRRHQTCSVPHGQDGRRLGWLPVRRPRRNGRRRCGGPETLPGGRRRQAGARRSALAIAACGPIS